MPLNREVEIGERHFVLVHGGLDNFSSSRPLSNYEPNELLWCRPEPDTVYYPDKYVVFGHTPVQLFAVESGEEPPHSHIDKVLDGQIVLGRERPQPVIQHWVGELDGKGFS